MWAAVGAAGIWITLLVIAVPADRSKLQYAFQQAVHSLTSEDSPARVSMLALALIGLLGLFLAGFYFASASLRRTTAYVLLASVVALLLVAAIAKLYFPSVLFLAIATYFGYRHARTATKYLSTH